MPDGTTTKEEELRNINAFIDDLEARTDLREPVEAEDGFSENIVLYDEVEHQKGGMSKLIRVSESKWAELRVSKKSLFGDILWDFRDEGSALYGMNDTKISWEQNVFEGVMLTAPECWPLLRLLNAVTFNYLPSNNILGACRSYNTVKSFFSGIMKVGRFLYAQRFFIDTYGNGSYLDATMLTSEDINRCVKGEPSISNRVTVASALKFWQDISDAGYLPKTYRLNKQVISEHMITEVNKERDENAGTFMPISLETLAVVVPHCVNLIENHSEEIIWAYDQLHPAFAGQKDYREQMRFDWRNTISAFKDHTTTLWDFDDFRTEKGSYGADMRQVLEKAIRAQPNWPEYRDKYFPASSIDRLFVEPKENMHDILRILGVDLTSVDLGRLSRKELLQMIGNHPDWPTLRSKRYKKGGNRLRRLNNDRLFDLALEMGIDLESIGDGTILYDLRKIRWTFQEVFTMLIDACFIIICLVTGMRRSELMHVKAGKAWRVPGTNDDYRLEFTVFKTDEASQGITVVVPIPEIAYKSYKVLERITEKARQFGGCDYLSVKTMFGFGSQMKPGQFNRRLNAFWENLGIEENIHPHMFRKTLAMFAIYQDPHNLTVIKHLFSHRSLAMTLVYIVKIPGLSDDIKLALVRHNADLLAEVLAAAKNEKIGGACGLRIKEQVKSGKLAARLNDEGRESIEQYIESLLEQGLRLLHRCPLSVVCTNMHDSVVNISPELCDCEVTNCDYAVFTENSVPELIQEIRFHEQWIKHPLVSEDQVKFASRKINDCLGRLIEIQGKEAVMADFPEHYGLVA
jgi:integrase